MNAVERFLYKGNTFKFISKMYHLLMNGGPKPGFHKTRMKWESYLNVTIDEKLCEGTNYYQCPLQTDQL